MTQNTIDEYRKVYTGDDETILMQVIGDMLEWCDQKKIDFQGAVESAQEMLRDCK